MIITIVKIMWKSLVMTVIVVGMFFVDNAYGQLEGYEAGVDYPAYNSIPDGLSFSCQNRLPGYYADLETNCQVWHWCVLGGFKYSFLCPNGTVFNQAFRICDWWTNVNCQLSEQLFKNNEELYRDFEGNLIVSS